MKRILYILLLFPAVGTPPNIGAYETIVDP